jgi:putative flippase GtrA
MADLDKVDSKVPFMESFYKSQIGSVLATATDMVVLIFCTELLHIYYVVSAAIGAVCGALVSFFLGRNWAFRKKDGKLSNQAIRYFFTSLTSLLLNVGGIYLLTDLLGFQYIMSKIIISAIVGIFFNFFMFRYFVYK